MIITRTPYRVSFAGGGSDLPAYCDREPGMVVSTTIDRHIYVQISRRFEPLWLVRYGHHEIASEVDAIDHPIVRECLKLHAPREPLEVVITGDLPGGTGLGSSSALTVGLLAALDTWRGRRINAKALAQQACMIEMGRLKKPIGYQDAYAAAFGGLNEIRFKAKGNVWVEPLREVRPEMIQAIEAHSLMFRVGETRSADAILVKQSAIASECRAVMEGMVSNASLARSVLIAGDIALFGACLHQGWALKRSLGCGISDEAIDRAYWDAITVGAYGGKLLGAGGGGFLFLIAPPERHQAIREALGHPKELPFRMSKTGTEVIYDDGVRS